MSDRAYAYVYARLYIYEPLALEIDQSSQSTSQRSIQSNTGWECAIECNWEHLESLLQSVSQAGWECAIESNWERTVKQAGSVPSSAIRSVLESMPRSVLENVLGGVLGSVLRAYLRA
jgi:hypothetical protein